MSREITVGDTGTSEITYKRGDPDEFIGLGFIKEVLCLHPYLNLSGWEMVGFTQADQKTHLVDSISVVIKNYPPKDLIGRFEIRPESNFSNYYQLKIGLDGSDPVLKVYDLTLGLYPLPIMPLGSCIHPQHGIGIHLGCPVRKNMRDIYLTHDDYKVVMDWCDLNFIGYPVYGDETKEGIKFGFGITWDQNTLKPVRLKRYVFPNDPMLKDPFSK